MQKILAILSQLERNRLRFDILNCWNQISRILHWKNLKLSGPKLSHLHPKWHHLSHWRGHWWLNLNHPSQGSIKSHKSNYLAYKNFIIFTSNPHFGRPPFSCPPSSSLLPFHPKSSHLQVLVTSSIIKNSILASFTSNWRYDSWCSLNGESVAVGNFCSNHLLVIMLCLYEFL